MASPIVVKITSLSSTGEGIGSRDSLKIFVEGTLPGETVSVNITEHKKTYVKAALSEVITPSPDRQTPPCPAFGECGGCQVMHLSYPTQLAIKRQRVQDALQRIGGFHDTAVLPCLPSPRPLGYRNKIQLPVVWDKNKKTIGLYRKKSHEVIPISRCFIQCPQGEEILAWISDKLNIPSVRYVLIRNAVLHNEAMVIFVTDGRFSEELKQHALELMNRHPRVKGVIENVNPHSNNIVLGSTFRLLAGRPHIFETLLNKTFKISPSAFFQINPEQTEQLYAKSLQLAEIEPHEIVVDAYCGVGALAIFAAAHAKRVFGFECITHAIADAKENAKLNGITNTSFLCGKAENLIKRLDTFDTVFLNPPRKGCDTTLLETILEKKPMKIIYISCDPATLARDLALLHKHYQITTVQPFDMFPQTMHVETVVRLSGN